MEVLQELKKVKNPSTIINSYLRSYFSVPTVTAEAEARARAEEAREVAAVFEAKAEEIKSSEPEIKELKTW